MSECATALRQAGVLPWAAAQRARVSQLSTVRGCLEMHANTTVCRRHMWDTTVISSERTRTLCITKLQAFVVVRRRVETPSERKQNTVHKHCITLVNSK